MVMAGNDRMRAGGGTISMIELNQEYRVKPAFTKTNDENCKSMVGRVVYIHPKGRYAVLEFEGAGGKARESFPMDQLTDKNRVFKKRR